MGGERREKNTREIKAQSLLSLPSVLSSCCLFLYFICALCWTCVPLCREANDQQVVVLLPVAHMHQMLPQQERRAEKTQGEGWIQLQDG